jgi:hypothetical protein
MLPDNASIRDPQQAQAAALTVERADVRQLDTAQITPAVVHDQREGGRLAADVSQSAQHGAEEREGEAEEGQEGGQEVREEGGLCARIKEMTDIIWAIVKK